MVDDGCFICAAQDNKVVPAPCLCTDRPVHAACLARMIESRGLNTKCPVCLAPYSGAKIVTKRRLSNEGVMAASMCVSSTATASVATILLIAAIQGFRALYAVAAFIFGIAGTMGFVSVCVCRNFSLTRTTGRASVHVEAPSLPAPRRDDIEMATPCQPEPEKS